VRSLPLVGVLVGMVMRGGDLLMVMMMVAMKKMMMGMLMVHCNVLGFIFFRLCFISEEGE